jgi:hypothetical protein
VACLADGTCVSAETARRLSCDCGVVEIVEDEHGAPLSVGRKRRTIPGSMKRALLQRDRTCRFPGCANRLYLEAHHVVHWADGGDTSLRNMVAACSLCRIRHNEHYAERPIMPNQDGDLDEEVPPRFGIIRARSGRRAGRHQGISDRGQAQRRGTSHRPLSESISRRSR